MADRRGYNGLRPIGPSGVPVIGSGLGRPTPEQVKQAIAHEIQTLAREMFARAVGSFLQHADYEGDCAFPSNEELHGMASACQRAAMVYFEAIGVITRESTPDGGSADVEP